MVNLTKLQKENLEYMGEHDIVRYDDDYAQLHGLSELVQLVRISCHRPISLAVQKCLNYDSGIR